MNRLSVILLAVLLLGGCGQRGSLYLVNTETDTEATAGESDTAAADAASEEADTGQAASDAASAEADPAQETADPAAEQPQDETASDTAAE